MSTSHTVSEHEIRRLFNESGYDTRPDILKTLSRRNEPIPEHNQPHGTVSETWKYTEVRNGRMVTVAFVHQYVLPDGRINNASGRPDPKYLRIGNDIYKVARP